MKDENAISGSPTRGLWGATLAFFAGFAAVALFGPSVKAFANLMNLSPMQIGFLVAIPALTGSLLRIPFAAWSDVDGGRKPILVLLPLSILGMAGLWFLLQMSNPPEHAYVFALLFGSLAGCGIAVFSVGIAQVSYWFPQKEQGRALAIFGGVGNLAPGIFSLLIPLAVQGVGLSGTYLLWLGFLLVGTMLYVFIGRSAPFFQLVAAGHERGAAQIIARSRGQELFPSGGALKSLAVSARVWQTWALVALYFTTFGGFIALTSWYPNYWQNAFGTTAVMAGVLTATYSLGTSFLRVWGGSLADRFGGLPVALGALVLVALGAGVVMLSSESFALAVLGSGFLATGMGINNAAVFKLVPRYVPNAVGGAAGWIGGLGAFGGFAITPLLAVFVASNTISGYAQGFVIYLALAMLSFGLVLILRTASQRGESIAK